MGAVWRAKQTEPVKRFVAVKLIKAGMDSKEVLARFEAERQALALMDHPNIARVLDGGVHAGRPFFVMELVKGVPITEYCDARKLTPKQRLELFVLVCQAIQHAHQKGIIHRDIKPSNVLIALYDDRPAVKVIDFGVAKATGGALTERTIDTAFGGVVGTPQYMSPEQATFNNLDIDTRSDVYALGILLFELLTGSPPFSKKELEKRGLLEMLRVVREEEPPRPSNRLSTSAALAALSVNRSTEPKRLTGQLRNELDWIVMKALEKDRARRYETANGFAADVQRYLANEPVTARPQSSAYRLKKTWQRNKVASVAVAAIAITLVVGIAVSTWQAVRAAREANRADNEATHALAALDELRETAPAFAEQARGLAAKDRFDEALEKLAYAAKLRPDAPEYLVARGDLLQSQLRLADAAAAYRAALEIHRDDARAKAGAGLCDELLAAPAGKEGKLSRESLSRLYLAMQRQQRPAAELRLVARPLGEEKQVVLAYWLERIKDLPVAADKRLALRLEVRDDGLLSLDLSGTMVADLAPLVGMNLGSLNVSGCEQIVDFTPIREFRALTVLKLEGTRINDLSSIRGLPIEELDLADTHFSELTALRGMKLKRLNIRNTQVSDLTPLAGMPLAYLDATAIPATDFSPLAGAPLESLWIQNSPLRDLSFLHGLPVKELALNGCSAARGFAAVAALKSLAMLILPTNYRELPEEDVAAIASLRNHPTLKNIEAIETTGFRLLRTTQSRDSFWKVWDAEAGFVSALRKGGFKFALTRLPTGMYRLLFENQPIEDHDLSMLQGAPISELRILNGQVKDLTPLRALPLRLLQLTGNPVEDLRPLRELRLEELLIEETKVRDLAPLAGLPLKRLYLHRCDRLADLSVLLKVPTLEVLTIPAQAGDAENLRKLPNLKWLAYGISVRIPFFPLTTTEQFWKEYDQQAWIRTLARDGHTKVTKVLGGTWAVDLDGASSFCDLEILKGAPLSDLSLGGTAVSDLEPLRGMKLKRLIIWRTAVTDLSPLAGMPIEMLHMSGTKVADLSPLRGMPLKFLWMHGCTEITDVALLANLKSLEHVTLPPNGKHFATLRQHTGISLISFSERAYRADRTAVEFWKEQDQRPWVKALQDADVKFDVRRLDDGWEVNLDNSTIDDLKPLAGAPISRLWLMKTDVSDLTPLRGMRVKFLGLYGTKVTDLDPLRGLPLEYLNLISTKVTDLSALRGMPLTGLKLNACEELTDVSPLADVKTLEHLTLPPNARNIEFLRALPKLARLSFAEDSGNGFRPDKTAAEFWKEYDANK